jgi:ERCC4-related helicase
MHRDFRINDFDIIIFDELHNCQVADHLYNQIMTEFYFNNENINDLPLVLGMISFEILFKQED